MKQRYLEVSFRKGKAFAAYLYLPRPSGARAASTVNAGKGVQVDMDSEGKPIGVEITAPTRVSSDDLNEILLAHGIAALDEREYAPLAA